PRPPRTAPFPYTTLFRSLKAKQGIFEIAVRYAFSGFAAMAPVMVAALFWKRSTKWGALAATLFTAGCLIYFAVLQNSHKAGDVIDRKSTRLNSSHRTISY